MKDTIRNAFADIRADDDLLVKTAAYLWEERAGREKKRSHFLPSRLAGALAAILVLALGIFGYYIFCSDAAAYVSIDVNPSLELTLNRTDKVIAATACNADGEALLHQIRVNGKPYDKAVSALLAEMERQGHISNGVLVTMTVQATGGAEEQRLCDALLQSVKKQTGSIPATVRVEVFPVTQEVRETAHGCHMSAARYLAIQELMEADETATPEAYSDATIRQIRQRTQECREEHGSGNTYSGGGSHGNGQGQENARNQNDGQGNGQQGGGREHGNGQGHGHQGR